MNKRPGELNANRGGRISKCAYTTQTHAGSTLSNNQLSLNVSRGALRVEMGF